MIHEIKVDQETFNRIADGFLKFVTCSDRDHLVVDDDHVALNEIDRESGAYTGRSLLMLVTGTRKATPNSDFSILSLDPCAVGESGWEQHRYMLGSTYVGGVKRMEAAP